MRKIVMIDNYDSFTFNLVQILESIEGSKVEVYRNDKITLNKVEEFDKIVLSPGPGLPSEAGMMPEIVKTFAATKSILGVCLGHQCIAEVFGGKLYNLTIPKHGKVSEIEVLDGGESLYKGLNKPLVVGRYHSWAVQLEGLPEHFEVTAVAEDGVLMSLRHREYRLTGVQFHPESILTPDGALMLRNWIVQG